MIYVKANKRKIQPIVAIGLIQKLSTSTKWSQHE